ncbi:hypothetical protein OHB44_10415 [Micromonospora sp. NBC_00821]|uniref:hypothetical protein n=1 Tax=Micromonospora sp. NBC_00821 TaxID=2975977 RepID=UPI002ED4BBAB|nr:hypothetical protein OHB44_10415 [Micromonospora sp. NBC_00821]
MKDRTDNLASRFFAEAVALIDVAWSAVAANDLRLPQAIGDRSMLDPQQRLEFVAVHLVRLGPHGFEERLTWFEQALATEQGGLVRDGPLRILECEADRLHS